MPNGERKMKARIALPILGAALLAACASQPRPLQGTFNEITPQQAAASDSTGAIVRWGGSIVAIQPQPNRTCFEMMSTRLSVYGRPYWAAADDVGGRFIACRTGFHDPALFEKNREVTFTGRIDGYENRRVGEYEYRFPRVEADVVYLWPAREYVANTRPAPWPWWGWW